MKQNGRSMLEMLGVLAIIGVLSIGAIAGYNFAVTKYKSNEIISELNERALLISAMFENGRTFAADEVIPLDMPATLYIGNKTESYQTSRNPDLFGIDVYEVDAAVCRMIMDTYEHPIILAKEAGASDEALALDCPAIQTDMVFFYTKDLSQKQKCTDKDNFNSADLSCCPAGTIAKGGTCHCPDKQIWSAEREACIESNCPTGSFETADNQCISCDEAAEYAITPNKKYIDICKACGNRDYDDIYRMCIKKKCTAGTFYTKYSGCALCGTKLFYNIGASDYARETCLACTDAAGNPNRYYGYVYCGIKGLCQTGKEFPNAVLGVCQSCNDINPYWVGNAGEAYEQCLACTNDAGVPNRRVTKSTIEKGECYKAVCDVGEFKAKNDYCYACTEPLLIDVGTGSGCEDAACGRVEENGKCKIAHCPTNTHTLINDGRCYPCDYEKSFASTKAECEACANRVWKESSKQCYLCPDETVLDEAGTACTCTTGQFFNWGDGVSTNARCSVCSDTQGVVASETECHKCDNQFYTLNGVCYGCNEATYSMKEATTLAICNRCSNRYFDEETSICELCPAGETKNAAGTGCE